MTNLQQGAPVLSARALRRLWFGAPALTLGVASLAMVAAVLAPMWQSLQRDNTRLRTLEELQVQVSLMRQQLRAQDIQEEKALQQRDQLFKMIAGSGDISTILAVLDREAKASGVQLDLFDPQAGGAAPAAQTPARPPVANQAQPPPPNPLEAAGLQPLNMLISLRGAYPNLLTFLKRLESLNLLVIQSDLRLEAPEANADPNKPAAKDVTMKLSLRVYGKPGGADTPAAAPATPPTGSAAPAAAPSPQPGAAPPAAAPTATPSAAARPGTPAATTPPAGSPAGR